MLWYEKLLFYHMNQLTHCVTNVSFISKWLQALKQITYSFRKNHARNVFVITFLWIIPESCLLSHFYKAVIAYTKEKSLAQHIATKHIYGEREIQKRLELNNVGPLISNKWKKSNKVILSPITDNVPKYDH